MLSKIAGFLKREKASDDAEDFITFYLDGDEICVRFKMNDTEKFKAMLESIFSRSVKLATIKMIAHKLESEGFDEEADYISENLKGRPIVRPSEYQ